MLTRTYYPQSSSKAGRLWIYMWPFLMLPTLSSSTCNVNPKVSLEQEFSFHYTHTGSLFAPTFQKCWWATSLGKVTPAQSGDQSLPAGDVPLILGTGQLKEEHWSPVVTLRGFTLRHQIPVTVTQESYFTICPPWQILMTYMLHTVKLSRNRGKVMKVCKHSGQTN